MSIVVTEMKYGKRIQADGDIEIVEKEKWERLNKALAEMERQINEMFDLLRNGKKHGLVRKDGSLDYEKFVICDSVNKGMSLTDTKARVAAADSDRDERAVTREYNRYTVQRGVGKGWVPHKIHEYLRSKGSTTQLEQVQKYADQFKRGKGVQ